MKLTTFASSTALAGLMAAVLPAIANAQVSDYLSGKNAGGSRPGQTYSSNAQPAEAAPARPYAAPAQQPAAQTPPVFVAPKVSDPDTRAGTKGKPVIMEFSDLECPDSARYNMSLKNTIMQKYVTTGKADYQWHDFPLPVHSHANEAAAAARCAGASADQVRRAIMANQGDMSAAAYTKYAREAGVSNESFEQCLRSGSSRQAVAADQSLGKSLGVRGTPTLVLGYDDGKGNVKPVKVVKAYDPPQQVLDQIDQFLASAQSGR